MVLVTPATDGNEVTSDGTKKKKLSNIEKSDGRRLVEYLVVVSSVPRKPEVEGDAEKGQEWNLGTSFEDDDVEFLHGFNPQITARYPLHDHEDNPLHENVTFFCHPSGSIHLKKQNFMPKVRELRTFFSFKETKHCISHLYSICPHCFLFLFVCIGPLLCCHWRIG